MHWHKNIAEVAIKSSTVGSIQASIHDVVARQCLDLDNAKADIERAVIDARARIDVLTQGNGGSKGSGFRDQREREGPKLNDARKSEVSALRDTMSKAAFVFWRDHLAMHLEDFVDYGIGTNLFLEQVRLHAEGILTHQDLQNFYGGIKSNSRENMAILGQTDVGKADRALHNFLHKRLTVKLKVASVVTCAAGHGLDLYRMISKKLDPTNAISEHAVLADVRLLAFMKCKKPEETKLRVVQFISLCNEFVDKVGREIDAQGKHSRFWMFMDDDTKARAERKQLVEVESTFTMFCDFLEVLTNDGETDRAIAECLKHQAPVRTSLSALRNKDAKPSPRRLR